MWILLHRIIPNKYLHNEQPHRSICINDVRVMLLPGFIQGRKITFIFLEILLNSIGLKRTLYAFISCCHRSVCGLITYACQFLALLFPFHWIRPALYGWFVDWPLWYIENKYMEILSLISFCFRLVRAYALWEFSFCAAVHYILLSTILSRHICLFH